MQQTENNNNDQASEQQMRQLGVLPTLANTYENAVKTGLEMH
jgi:hypothetical protein